MAMKQGCRLAVRISFLLLLGAALCAAAWAATEPAKRLTPQNRLGIVRALAYEYAVARQPLPASQKEEEGLEVSSTGALNENRLRQHLANRGAAVHTGEIVQITAVTFKRSSILLDINGGGQRKKKWYQRIRVEGSGGPIGGNPIPQAPPPAGSEPRSPGSWIVLSFPHPLPDLPPDEVKRLLAAALDFSQRSPTVPWIETIPEEFRQAIKEKKAVVGMNREMVLAALGRPQQKVRETQDGRETEDWIYGHPPFLTFVTFVEDEVVEVKQYR